MKHCEDYDELEKIIDYKFTNRQFLMIALTHSSFANEMRINKCEHYERQEFLGDAVLELVSSDFLFSNNPDKPEGELTKIRASMVCEPALAYCARSFGLDKYMRLGRGEEATGGRTKDSITSDILEALIGAIYLDSGFEEARKFIYNFILSDVDDRMLFYDAKSILQERIQASGKKLEYVLIDEHGPDHEKVFVIEARIDGVAVSTGEGRTKKAAQQHAAYEVLRSNKCI